MTTLSPYKNEEILETIKAWWYKTYPNNIAQGAPLKETEGGWFTRDQFGILELFQSYSEFVVAKEHYHSRLTIDQFAKCIMQCRIVDLGGSWVHTDDWFPKEWEVRRATANIMLADEMIFFGQLEIKEKLN